MQSESGLAPVQGGELYYEVTGEGTPLVLIHAGVADHTMWDAQVAAFAPHYRVIRYDMRGFGRSRTESCEFSNRQDLRDLLAHLGVKSAYVLGISRGGHIALDFALEFPDQVKGLILVAAGVGGYQLGDAVIPAEEQAMFDEMEQLLEAGEFDRLNEMEVHAFVNGPGQPADRADPAVRALIARLNRANYGREDGKATPLPLTPPAFERLAEVHVPTLVLIGDLDETVSVLMADALAKGIPGATKVAFPDVAHMVNLEQPERFNHGVLGALERWSGGAGER
ncbi:MAG: alpha/beta hydrolase [Ardenticatenales bacterium]|nr:alpha/beta hydrolase [Ardenticatenales bacterium]